MKCGAVVLTSAFPIPRHVRRARTRQERTHLPPPHPRTKVPPAGGGDSQSPRPGTASPGTRPAAISFALISGTVPFFSWTRILRETRPPAIGVRNCEIKIRQRIKPSENSEQRDANGAPKKSVHCHWVTKATVSRCAALIASREREDFFIKVGTEKNKKKKQNKKVTHQPVFRYRRRRARKRTGVCVC